jgi:hypothetical protein
MKDNECVSQTTPTTNLPEYRVVLTPPRVAAYFIARHPDLFRVGQPARIIGVVFANGRPCFRVRYADSMEDDTPIVNEDFTGQGGLGYFYDIVPEGVVTNGQR